MGIKPTGTRSDGVLQHEGLLWRPRPGATSTAEEFLAARARFLALHKESRWNPWVLEDYAAEMERAMAVMEQWGRAEPGHRYLTDEEIEARFADMDREHEARFAAMKRRQEQDRERYDRDREAARLALLEEQAVLGHELEDLEEYRAGTRFPKMDAEKRANAVAGLEKSIAARRAEVDRLAAVVGDPEDVVDENGRRPGDRREDMLIRYRVRRQFQVRELRAKVSELTAALASTTDRAERAALRKELNFATWQLDELLAVPPLTADDMCSECAAPAASHRGSMTLTRGPCPAWPRWAAKIEQVRQMLESSAARKAPEPTLPKPQPLAVVPSGLPIGEVVERLTALHAAHPNSEVRRGRAGRFELWPLPRSDE